MNGLELTADESQSLFQIIDELSGGNPENVFVNDGTDTLDSATTRAFVKLFRAVGRNYMIPENLNDSLRP